MSQIDMLHDLCELVRKRDAGLVIRIDRLWVTFTIYFGRSEEDAFQKESFQASDPTAALSSALEALRRLGEGRTDK